MDASALQPEQWARYLRPVLARRRVVIGIVLATLLAVAVATLLAPKTYTTSAKLLVGGQTGDEAAGRDPQTELPVLNSLLELSNKQSAETYAELLQEEPVARQVIANLNLPTTPKALLAAVSVKPVTNTSIMRLSVSARSAEQSAAIANEFAHVFVTNERKLVAGQADEALTYLQVQLPAAERRMHDAQSRLAKYESASGLPDVGGQTQSLLTQQAALDSKISQVETEGKQAAAQLASIDARLASLPERVLSASSSGPNPALAQLQTQRAQLEVQLNTARREYTEQHPAVQTLEDQLREVETEIAAQPKTVVSGENTTTNPVRDQLVQQAAGYEATVKAAAAQIADLRAQRAALAPTLKSLPSQTNRIADLRRSAKSAEDVYNELQRKNEEALVSKTTALSDVSVIEPATVESAVKRPRLGLNLAIALIVGLVLGCTVAYALDFFDGTLKDEYEVTEYLGLPVLANVPTFVPPAGPAGAVVTGLAGYERLPTLAHAHTAGASSLDPMQRVCVESFFHLVTALRYSTDKPLRSLCVTSALAGEGKSTIALNAAVALAELQPRVLLVDGDMRRPTIHSGLRVGKGRGLSDVLAGTARFEDVIQRSPHPSLDVVTSGSPTPNPLKLLQSERFGQMLEEAAKTYATVIVDGPALNFVLDGAIIAEKTDATMLVVSSGTTDVRQSRKALDRLATVGVDSVLGIVVNRANLDFLGKNPYYSSYDDEESAAVVAAHDA